MTQALNLANFANNLNTAGATSNAGLQNSTISGVGLGSNLNTLTIGTGLSGSSYNGSSAVTITNAGVTSVTAGTGISVSASTGGVTITNSSPIVSATIAKAWCTFSASGSTVSVTKSYNVSSITVVTSGSQYTVNFTSALADANYVALGNSVWSSSGGNQPRVMCTWSAATTTTTSCQFRPYSIGSASNESDQMYVAFFD